MTQESIDENVEALVLALLEVNEAWARYGVAAEIARDVTHRAEMLREKHVQSCAALGELLGGKTAEEAEDYASMWRVHLLAKTQGGCEDG